jgi:hypothetical protein
MQQRSQSIGRSMRHIDAEETSRTYEETDMGTRGKTYQRASGSSQRPAYVPHPLRELLKPILDELKDKLESFEGEPTPEDHRWLRGQLRKLADRLATE